MKKGAQSKSVFIAALLVLAFGFGPFGSPVGTVQAAEWPADAYVLRVDGLACPYCGYGVEKQFSQQAGVRGTDIDIENGVVIVTVAAGTRFSSDELERIVHDAGFELGRIVQRPAGE